MEFTAKQIAEFVGGHIEGNAEAKVSTFAKIEEGREGALSFLSNPKYTHFIYETKSSVVLIGDDVVLEREVKPTLVRVKNAYEAVARLLQLYEQMKPRRTGIDPTASISAKATVGQNVYIGAYAVIGDGAVVGDGAQIYPHVVVGDGVSIGSETKIYPNVTIYEGCRIGSRCTLHAGAVIGADGFGFAPGQDGYDKIPQIGIVVIEDDVEIGANTCVDRSTMGQTVIHRGVKLDNLIQVAHNCEVGENTVMSAQVGLAGSTKIGQWCMVGGQAGFAGHIQVADRTNVGAQCGVIKNTKGQGETLIGSPAMDPKIFFKAKAIYSHLPDMYRELAQLRREVEDLNKKLSGE
ncbi:MAG: UDP-3-O-(3-hydroxymyristoyl)glucosamine N-acyltransferase [Prevotella sp.]|nr:UDP-3-O-(3-hydroxymyristoyl)glucosamine N-acyltransferase [Prevotella sp.]